ncbi:MAG: hypothetical protein HUJ25_07280 [Crocinitomicaceae bacterium]|nr:hypothetical protein [Crocinitomicaceae bacterium]
MKKVLIASVLGLFITAMTSCGGRGHICEAYGGQADYTKYKVEHNQKVQMLQKLTEKE